eukprot:CAMPEP_0176378470 /NCGR_PEP_ID=MMETSP0126-20121128/29640_1 /TAXON_ID=141414 ORGANISM="Strombidinopsis acuminatum, Strain SPMC142" /NCGR_SAMPLE_ID=MMETSP0126 /ASSEMBLY_ACC=CAM_ASM_000229 /LENGTH=95 /DNA_ID=CAMNT_0017740779 /DNA_START=46 /DNA_END=333 /DNA_ORIENTATION=+
MVNRAIVAAPRMNFNKFDDKRSGEESMYFSKQDAKVMKNLLEKMEKRGQMPAKHQVHDAICSDLDAIFAEHSLDKQGSHSLLYQELMEWKRHNHE